MGMKNHVKELTEGMQRLCAVANRVVQEPRRIDVDLFLECLRDLYDVALGIEGKDAEDSSVLQTAPLPQGDAQLEDDSRLMAMVSTMAAMGEEAASVLQTEPLPQESTQPEGPSVDPSVLRTAPLEGEQLKRPDVQTHSVLQADSVEEEQKDVPPVLETMEELEQNDNALLFDEVIIEEEPSDDPSVLRTAPLEGEQLERPDDEAPEASDDPSVLRTAALEGEQLERAEHREFRTSVQSGQGSLLDYLNQPAQRTLGETLGADRPQPGSLERKVEDLRTVININDKFSFMSELFHNNMKAYNDFIMSLNAIATRDEAMALVQETAAQQRWDEDSATVQEFYKVFDKKF